MSGSGQALLQVFISFSAVGVGTTPTIGVQSRLRAATVLISWATDGDSVSVVDYFFKYRVARVCLLNSVGGLRGLEFFLRFGGLSFGVLFRYRKAFV